MKKYLNDYTDDSIAVILRAKPEACPERSEGTNKTLHFVQGDTSCQIPRFARNDNEGKPCSTNLKFLKIILKG